MLAADGKRVEVKLTPEPVSQVRVVLVSSLRAFGGGIQVVTQCWPEAEGYNRLPKGQVSLLPWETDLNSRARCQISPRWYGPVWPNSTAGEQM
jgi:hypothetical protein